MADNKSTFDLPEVKFQQPLRKALYCLHQNIMYFFVLSTQASNRERLEQEKKIKEYELKKKAASVVVPTDDGRVRQMLRQLEEPITLFGEREVRHACHHASPIPDPALLRPSPRPICNTRMPCSPMQMERRERLRRLLAQQAVELDDTPAIGQLVVETVATIQVPEARVESF